MYFVNYVKKKFMLEMLINVNLFYTFYDHSWIDNILHCLATWTQRNHKTTQHSDNGITTATHILHPSLTILHFMF